MVIALKDAKGVDTTLVVLPAAYSDAKQDCSLANPGNVMVTPNLAHPSLSVSSAYTIQI